MGISRASIAKAVNAAFTAVGDIAESVTLQRSSSSYDTSTGDNTITTTSYTIEKAVFTKYKVFEIDKVYIKITDVKMIFKQSELSITPSSSTDTIVRNSKTYNIIDMDSDPADATYILQLRSP